MYVYNRICIDHLNEKLYESPIYIIFYIIIDISQYLYHDTSYYILAYIN